jgi:hypothetical protein
MRPWRRGGAEPEMWKLEVQLCDSKDDYGSGLRLMPIEQHKDNICAGRLVSRMAVLAMRHPATLLARLLRHADATVIEGNRYRVSRRKFLLTKLC